MKTHENINISNLNNNYINNNISIKKTSKAGPRTHGSRKKPDKRDSFYYRCMLCPYTCKQGSICEH